MGDAERSFSRMVRNMGGNRSVLALSLARMADALGNSILLVVLPILVVRIPEIYVHAAAPILVGILLSAYGFVNSFFQPLFGALGDRLGRRKPLILLGLGVMALSTAAFMRAGDFLSLLLLRALQGVGVAITVSASMALMAGLTEKRSRGGSMGIYSTFRMAGFAIGPLLGGVLLVHFGFNAAFLTGAGFILLAMLLVQLWVPEAQPQPVEAKTGRPFRLVDLSLISPGILSAGLATFLMAGAFSMVTTLENEFNARLNITAVGFSAAFSALMVGRLLFQLPLGRLSDRIGRRPLVLWGLILLAPVTALLGVTTTLWQLTSLRVIQGIASAAIAAPAFAVAADLSRAGGEGRQMSLITMGFSLGLAVGPLLAGVLAVVFFELPFLAGGVLSLLGAGVVYRWMPETLDTASRGGNVK